MAYQISKTINALANGKAFAVLGSIETEQDLLDKLIIVDSLDKGGNPIPVAQADWGFGWVEFEAQRSLDVADSLWNDLRAERDSLLAETDWWVLPDRTPTQEQLDYRQALRDLPANTDDPANPVWPVKP